MKGELHVTWVHADECPARPFPFGSDSIDEEAQSCRCGMPDTWSLSVLHEHATETLQKGVENGHATIPGSPS